MNKRVSMMIAALLGLGLTACAHNSGTGNTQVAPASTASGSGSSGGSAVSSGASGGTGSGASGGGMEVRGSTGSIATPDGITTSDRAISRRWDGIGSTGGGTGTGIGSGTTANPVPSPDSGQAPAR